MPRGDAVARGDDAGRWLMARRGPFVVVVNLAEQRQAVPLDAPVQEVVLSTNGAAIDGHAVFLPPMSGAVVR